jgi:adenine phosphoribosyltransferase
MDLQTRIKSSIRDIPDFPKPGILFRDITPVLADPSLCLEIVNEIYRQLQTKKVDGIVGIESRGFLFGMMLAQKFNVPFLPVRKKGKLPFKTYSYEYTLEYGSAVMEMHIDSVKKGSNVIIHDDLLATGGTAAAAAELVKMQGGTVSAFSFLISLDFLDGKSRLKQHSPEILSLINY